MTDGMQKQTKENRIRSDGNLRGPARRLRGYLAAIILLDHIVNLSSMYRVIECCIHQVSNYASPLSPSQRIRLVRPDCPTSSSAHSEAIRSTTPLLSISHPPPAQALSKEVDSAPPCPIPDLQSCDRRQLVVHLSPGASSWMMGLTGAGEHSHPMASHSPPSPDPSASYSSHPHSSYPAVLELEPSRHCATQ